MKIDTVWDRTIAFLRDRLSAVAPFALFGLVVPNVILTVLTSMWATTAQAGRAGLSLMVLAMVVVMLWALLAITIKAVEPLDHRATATLALRRLGPAAGIYLLLGLIFGALLLPLSMLSAFGGISQAALQMGGQMRIASSGLGWSLMLYLLALMIVMLVLAARLVPLNAVVVAERRGVRAITRAWRLTRGMTWRLIAVVLLYYIVSAVAELAVQTVFGTVFRLFGSSDGGVTVPVVLTAFVTSVVSVGFTTLAAIFAGKLYVALADTAGVEDERSHIATSL